ncbi:hypothetical protein SNE40_017588 [Patella caerulea]|uniref:Uncharacterized protein n=1 Tax=Patella caerulea TaxID=87958 RepID=A0AAN8JI81_PATCE
MEKGTGMMLILLLGMFVYFGGVENMALSSECEADEFNCGTTPAECMPLSWRCDGDEDCDNGDDEKNCPTASQCRDNQFSCQVDGEMSCISNAWRCDDDVDCTDGTDENNCTVV